MKHSASIIIATVSGFLSLDSHFVIAQPKVTSFSAKCGKTVYNCGATPSSHICLIPGAAKSTNVPVQQSVCKKISQAIKQKKIFSDDTICPKDTKGNPVMVSYYTQNTGNNGGAGRLCSASLCKKCTHMRCGGDPHFMTIDGTAYTYHGQCDLVMAKSNNLDNTGLSLDVHARTTIKGDWSYVSNVAIKIGNDILEITTDSNITHYLNGEANVDFPILLADKYIVRQSHVEPFPGQIRTDYKIDLKVRDEGSLFRGDTISIKNFKEMLTLDVEAQLTDSIGMLGVSGEEGVYKRDLVTRLDRETQTAQMGIEWQVRSNEPKLFVDRYRAPQFPEQCFLPKVSSRKLRSLQSLNNADIAKTACANVDSSMREFCVHDVMLTGDAQVAHMYEF
jgi:von Willebrand factor type D domain